MWIMIAGPYTSGAASETERQHNLNMMNEAAYAVWCKGHVPIIGVNMALPIIHVAGPATFDQVMMPLSLALAERCDAALRIGGPSAGADAEIARLQAKGMTIFWKLDQIPEANNT